MDIEQIKNRLKRDLPGLKSHQKMAPTTRPLNHQDFKKDARFSAVSIVLFEDNGTLQSILIQRPIYEGSHSGQIAFPGGKQEKNETLLTTSIRETKEEIGVTLDPKNLIGQLTDVYIPVSNFLLSPFVFYINERPKLELDDYEVANCFFYDIAELNQNSNRKIKNYSSGKMTIKDVPYFELPTTYQLKESNNQLDVWGATALVLSELADVIVS